MGLSRIQCVVIVVLSTLSFSGLSAQCTAPGLEDFDGATPGALTCTATTNSVFPQGWSLGVGSTLAWHVDNNGTSSGGTGPSFDHTTQGPLGNYVVVETSCSAGSWVAHLESPCFDASALANPTVSFWYHMYGQAMGTLEIQSINSGGNWVTSATISGDQGNQWRLFSAPVIEVQGSSRVRFRYTRGSGFSGDCALDDISFGEPPTPAFEVNSAESSLDFGGLQGTPFTSPTYTVCTGGQVVANFASTLNGTPWDLGFSATAAVPSSLSALVTGAGQVVSLDLLHPSLGFLLGGSEPSVTSTWAGSFSLRVNAPSFIGDAVFQMLNVSPAHPDGSEISQPCQLDIAAPSAQSLPLLLTMGDDSSATIDLGPSGVCFNPIRFYGQVYSQFHVSSNGRVLFGGADTDLSPSRVDALGDNPFVGFWTDLNPSQGGTVRVTSPVPGVISVDFYAVPYHQEPTTANTFAIVFDTVSDVVVMQNLQGIDSNPVSSGVRTPGDDQFLGMSKGNLGATDGGAIPFGITANSVLAVSSAHMIYDFIGSSNAIPLRPFSLAQGLDRISFFPVGNTYAWRGFP